MNEYNPSVHNFSEAIVDCSYMFRLLQSDHHQAVYQKYKKISSGTYMSSYILLTFLVNSMMIVTLELKHVAAIYNCYTKVVH
jgi:hypothetical protein